MTNLPNDNQHNLASFLHHHKPNPPQANMDLEQMIMNSLEPQISQRNFIFRVLIKTMTQTIANSTLFRVVATGFLFTSVSFCLKTPRIAIEPKDLENFVVKNWHDTLQKRRYTAAEKTEAYWPFPTVTESSPNLSVSAQ